MKIEHAKGGDSTCLGPQGRVKGKASKAAETSDTGKSWIEGVDIATSRKICMKAPRALLFMIILKGHLNRETSILERQFAGLFHFRIELWIAHDKPILFSRFVLCIFGA